MLSLMHWTPQHLFLVKLGEQDPGLTELDNQTTLYEDLCARRRELVLRIGNKVPHLEHVYVVTAEKHSGELSGMTHYGSRRFGDQAITEVHQQHSTRLDVQLLSDLINLR